MVLLLLSSAFASDISPERLSLTPERQPMSVQRMLAVQMAPHEFQALLSNVADATSQHDRLRVIRLETRAEYLTMQQLTKLMQVSPFFQDRLEMVELVASRIVDPENAHLLFWHGKHMLERDALAAVFED